MWNLFIINPFTNALLYLYSLVGNSFTLAIVIFTVLIRLLTMPLLGSSQRNQQKMQAMQPQIKEIQDKYRDQPEKMNAEFARLGFNPVTSTLGGCLPMLLQFPVMIGLYQSINHVMAVTPLSLVDLYHAIYPFFPNFDKLIPVNNHFLWLNLALPDQFYVLPVLVAATTYLSQLFITPPPQPGADQQTTAMTKQMGIMMTLMFGMFSLNFASGLSIYFIVSNLISMVQYPLMNAQQRARLLAFIRREPAPAIAAPVKSGRPTAKPAGKSGKPAKAGAKK